MQKDNSFDNLSKPDLSTDDIVLAHSDILGQGDVDAGGMVLGEESQKDESKTALLEDNTE